MAGPITISIIGDNRGLNSSLNESEGRLKRLGGIAGGAGKAIAGGLLVAGAAAVGFGVAAVKSASDAQQSIGATETVFGRFASRVIKDSEAAASQFGLSANEYRENANLIGSLFRNQGVSADQLAGKTKGMISTAADLAATFGGPTSDAVAALGSAFKGEFDPLERYGISIKQSTINAELAAKGQDKLTGAALKAAQQQATSRLIMEQSSRASGAFARETDTLAHQQQVLGASWENIKAKAGGVLLPVLTSAAQLVTGTVIPALERMGPPAAELARQIGGQLGPAVSAVTGALSSAAPIAQAYGAYVLDLGRSIATNVIPPVIAVAGYIGRTFGPVLRQVGGIIIGQVLPAVQTFGRFITGTMIPVVAKIATQIGRNLKPIFDQIAGSLRKNVLPAVQQAAAKFREWQPTIQKVIVVVAKITGTVLVFAAKILGVVLPPVIRFAGFLAGTLIKSVVGAIGVIIRIGGAVIDAGQKFVNGVQAVARFVGAVNTKIGEAIRTVAGLPGKVLGAVSGIGSTLVNAGRDLIQGFIDGIGDMFDDVQGKLGDLTGKLTSWKGPPKRDRKLLRGAGRLIIKGLIDGFQDGYSGVKGELKKVTDFIKKSIDLKDNKAELKRENAVVGALKKRYAQLLANGRAQDANTKKLDAAKAKLKEVIDYAAGVRQQAIDFAKITGAGVLDEDGRTTAGSITQGLTERLAAIREFTAKIEALRKAGLNKASLDQLIAEGVEGGMATAQALVAGGAGAIAEVNDLAGQIAQAAGQLGNTGAAAMYKGGVTAAQQLVAGLESQQDKLDRAAARMGQALSNAIRKALGGKGAGKGDSAGKNNRPRISVRDTYSSRPKLSDDAKAGGPGAPGAGSVSVKLTAEQLSRLERGKSIQLDLDAYHGAGGKPRA